MEQDNPRNDTNARSRLHNAQENNRGSSERDQTGENIRTTERGNERNHSQVSTLVNIASLVLCAATGVSPLMMSRAQITLPGYQSLWCHGFLFFPFRYWQLKCLQLLENQNNREIMFVIDPVGGVGKTFLSKYLTLIHGAARFDNGKSADIKYLYQGEKVVIFDLCKSQRDHINYEVIEQIKNGILCSYKYQSERKVYNIPKIVVFMNEMAG